MEVFEFHFNPKAREDLIFDSFCYEPENIYEKKLGSLYLLGELKNALPQNLKLINEIAKVVKERYYTISFQSSEKALSESLKKLNEFLANQVKKENVSWLGNLSLAILGLVLHQERWWEINFTKVGSMRVFLLRGGKITEISKNLEFQEIEPYPLKIFTNIVSGKLIEGDKILVLTKEVFDFFLEQRLLEKLARLDFFEEKKLREVFDQKELEISKISGILLALDLKKTQKEIKEKKPVIFQPKPEKFSLSQIFSQIKFPSWKTKTFLGDSLKKIATLFSAFSRKKEKIFSRLIFEKTQRKRLPSIRILLSKIQTPLFLKRITLIFLLLIVLFLGYFFAQKEKEKEIKLAREVLEKVETKRIQAENFLILKEERQANLLFQEALKEILSQTKMGAPLKKEALAKKEAIEKELFLLNKLERNPSLELIFEFKAEEMGFLPQKILFSNSNLYFFNPFSSKIYQFNLKEKTGFFLEGKRNLKLAVEGVDSIFFFSNPNVLLSLKEGSLQTKTLQPWRTDFHFDEFSAFKSNLYFLDSQSGEIVKYSGEDEMKAPKLWLNPQTKKATSSKSMAVDGSIWILTKNNQIDRYYAGFYQETLKLEFWPSLENPTKIFTLDILNYLYLLEPAKKRIIILTKNGKIVKQFQSEKFDYLLDFAVSENSKKIYLLNGPKVYQINFNLP